MTISMSGQAADTKRLLHITAGNLRNAHLYVSDHLDFFPDDIVGPSKLDGSLNGRAVRIHLEGLNETIEAGIGSDPRTGKPRGIFRKRSWVRRFFEFHRIVMAGDAYSAASGTAPLRSWIQAIVSSSKRLRHGRKQYRELLGRASQRRTPPRRGDWL